jgi:hypothetical protein
MSLDQLLAQCELERRRRGVSFVIDPDTFAIGTTEPSFRSPLEFLADCRNESGGESPLKPAVHSELFGMTENVIEQLIVVSDGGCCGYLRDRLEAACGLDATQPPAGTVTSRGLMLCHV